MDKIAVIDFGGQYTHLIANRIRRLGVYSEIKDSQVEPNELEEYRGIILSGGPSSVYDKNSPKYNANLFLLNKPILGICYGHQSMTQSLGGIVSSGKIKEYGPAQMQIIDNRSLFSKLDGTQTVWMSHGDEVTTLPPGFKIIGSSDSCKIAAMANEEKNFFGLQFHPEVTHTKKGMEILDSFLDICQCKKEWNMKRFLENIKEEIKTQAKDKNVFLLVSGGVDSSVLFALLENVLGKSRVYGLHIDNGLMRLDESRNIVADLSKVGFDNLHFFDGADFFLNKLKGVYEPEKKRLIIGDAFMDAKDEALKELDLNPDDWLVAQGTIYPDTIESGGTKNSSLIKTHHNRVDKVQKLIQENKIIEPLKELYKDEVRILGAELGLLDVFVNRHPFPGPGLGVRCLCSNEQKVIGSIFGELNKKITLSINSTYNVFVLGIKSVGVQGDFRTYKHPALLVGVHDWDRLEHLSSKITNNFSEVNRVLYLLSKTNLENQKIKKSFLSKDRLDLLRKADNIVNKFMSEQHLYSEIWQFPIVLVPLLINDKECLILRPVQSVDAMTADFYKMDFALLQKLTDRLMALDLGAVFYDVTNKPPGTIEWE